MTKIEKDTDSLFGRVSFIVIFILFLVWLICTPSGRCIASGGEIIDSYANMPPCDSKEECAQYVTQVCVKDGDIIWEDERK